MTNYQKQVKWSGIIRRWVSYQSEYWAVKCLLDLDKLSEHGLVLDEKMRIIHERLNWLESHPLGAHWRNRNRPGRNRLKYWPIGTLKEDLGCIICREESKAGQQVIITNKSIICLPCYNEFREGEYSKFSQITRYKDGKEKI